MARITVYDVPENTLETFKQVCKKQGRFMTRQLLFMIELANAEFKVTERAERVAQEQQEAAK